ncbi:MAG: DUF4286 family protein [Cytophagaceae bacterium]|nr:DUF4286 family protein [Cytophagaceae bacterium]
MILYSITIHIEKAIYNDWFPWMKNEFIPAMFKTGLFQEYKILHLLKEDEESTGITYSFQFFLKELNYLETYENEFRNSVESELYSRFRNQFVEFRTVLEVVG